MYREVGENTCSNCNNWVHTQATDFGACLLCRHSHLFKENQTCGNHSGKPLQEQITTLTSRIDKLESKQPDNPQYKMPNETSAEFQGRMIARAGDR
jgi:hypothetical protein